MPPKLYGITMVDAALPREVLPVQYVQYVQYVQWCQSTLFTDGACPVTTIFLFKFVLIVF